MMHTPLKGLTLDGMTMLKQAGYLRYLTCRVFAVLTVCAILWGSAPQSPAIAQEIDDAWTKPVAIVKTDGQLGPGAMASDSQGNLHVLFTHTPDKVAPVGIDYLYWNGVEWSTPVSVLINPNGSNAMMPRLVIDQFDVMHVVWGDGATLYYAASPAATAGSARSWSSPVAIGQAILTPIGLTAGPRDDLYVAYSDASLSGQVSMITSTDRGMSWSAPIAIAQTAADTVPGDVRLVLDDSGRLHATWTAYSLAEGNTALGVYYTHNLENQIAAWEEPLQFAGPRHGQAGIVTVGENEVHVVWRSNIGGDGTFHQWSNDGGTSWSNPDRFDDRGGFSGLAYLAIDSLKRVHYTVGSVFYTMWSRGRLAPYQDVATAEVRGAATVSNGETAILSITRGNRVHVIFQTDFNQIWYATRLLAAPEIISPAVEVGQPTVESGAPTRPSAETSAVALPTEPTPAPSIMSPGVSDSKEPQSSTLPPLLLGIAPAVLLVAAVLLVHQTRRRR